MLCELEGLSLGWDPSVPVPPFLCHGKEAVLSQTPGLIRAWWGRFKERPALGCGLCGWRTPGVVTAGGGAQADSLASRRQVTPIKAPLRSLCEDNIPPNPRRVRTT